eukprot:2890187-Pleurochrysis_carterae.AAC.1
MVIEHAVVKLSSSEMSQVIGVTHAATATYASLHLSTWRAGDFIENENDRTKARIFVNAAVLFFAI